ncbi:hypothetical protein ES703_105146 [subsurface metagenome]
MGKGFIRWCRRHIIRTNLALIGIEIAVACLVWFIFDGRQTFGPLNTYAIVCLSVVVASIAALNSMFASVSAHDSLVTTQESLELTRNSIRPFLYAFGPIDPKTSKSHVKFTFTIHNSGSLPANDVKTDIQFFDKDEEVTEGNSSSKYAKPTADPVSPILFPNDDIYLKYSFDLKDANDAKLWKNMQNGKIKYRARITYTSLGRKHETIQTVELLKQAGEKGLARHPIPPQKWK